MKTISISNRVKAITESQTMKRNFLMRAAMMLMFFCASAVFAQVNIPIGNLAPGETVTITYDVILTNAFPAGITSVTNQGTITGSNFATSKTDDPQTAAIDDATATFVEIAPIASTVTASNVTTTSATLNASVNPNNLSTIAYFQFGTTPGYGSFSATNNLSATNISLASSAVIANLLPGTLYHYRVVATNLGGTTTGSDLTFQTISTNVAPPAPPIITGITKQPNQTMLLHFSGESNVTYTLQTSTNLPQWNDLTNISGGASATFNYNDVTSTNYPNRLYRLKTP